MSRVQFTRCGLKYDYTGAHVTWSANGRRYMGAIVSDYLRDLPPASYGLIVSVRMFKVRHFNGEAAPDVAALDVEVLEREYESID